MEESNIKNVRKMVLCSMLATLMAVCAWISIPLPPLAFSAQTLGVLLTLGLLGGKWGTVSILLYLLLGAVGLPVFSGFQTGAVALPGPTGGFLWGFVGGGLTYRLLERLGKLPAMIGAQLVIYLCGSWWFSVYAGTGIGAAALTCVVPYLIPDDIKLLLALTLSERVGKHLQS